MMVSRELVASGSSYMQIASLESGVYWLRFRDGKTGKSCVNQLLIK
jgi:hypothetical protein